MARSFPAYVILTAEGELSLSGDFEECAGVFVDSFWGEECLQPGERLMPCTIVLSKPEEKANGENE